ncbi:MAG: hypothetical protein ACI9MC_003962 [Kiritimatiellia bacterium]
MVYAAELFDRLFSFVFKRPLEYVQKAQIGFNTMNDNMRRTLHTLKDMVTWLPEVKAIKASMEQAGSLSEVQDIMRHPEHDRLYTAVRARYPLTSLVGGGHQRTFLCMEHTPSLMHAKQGFVEAMARCADRGDRVEEQLLAIKWMFDDGVTVSGATHSGVLQELFTLWVRLFFTQRLPGGTSLERYPHMHRVAKGSNDLRNMRTDPKRVVRLALKFRSYDAELDGEIDHLMRSMDDGLLADMGSAVEEIIDVHAYAKELVAVIGILYAMVEKYHEIYYLNGVVVCSDYRKPQADIFDDLYVAYRKLQPVVNFNVARRDDGKHTVISSDVASLVRELDAGQYTEEEIAEPDMVVPARFADVMDTTQRGCPFGSGKYRCGGEIVGLYVLMWLDRIVQGLPPTPPLGCSARMRT